MFDLKDPCLQREMNKTNKQKIFLFLTDYKYIHHSSLLF